MRAMQGRRDDARWRRQFPSSALLATAIVSVAACGSADVTGDDVEPVGVAGYSAVIADFLPPAPTDDERRPVVYVVRLNAEQFRLEDQVAMIEQIEEQYDLRFVDDVDAAVDDEDAEATTRDDGMLLGIGTISAVAPHVVRVEVHDGTGPVEALKVTLSFRDDVWRVDTSEPVEPEVLVGGE